MTPRQIQRALISVHDKTGIVDFTRALREEFGIQIIATGGTALLLEENGIPVTRVEEITGFGEMLDGRVKTLHPKIFGAILADRDNPEHMRQLADAGIKPIDMVVVNLYPFEQVVAKPDCSFEEAIEMIDIGGPSLLRAAAKNHQHVLPVVCHPVWLEQVLDALRGKHAATLAELARGLAKFTFVTTRTYDQRIWDYLTAPAAGRGPIDLDLVRFQGGYMIPCFRDRLLRYGENPHQNAAVYTGTEPDLLPSDRHLRNPQPPSFNNYADASAAVELCAELTRVYGLPGAHGQAVCAFIKHTNACGCGIAHDPVEAYQKAYLGDPNAAMGGVLGVGFNVDAAFAEAVMQTYDRWGKGAGAGGFFAEVWIAPSFDNEAVKVIRSRKEWGQRVRLLSAGRVVTAAHPDEMDVRRIVGGLLMQTPDQLGLNEEKWYTVTDRPPTDQEMSDLRLAWLVCKHTKSNAISLVRDGQLIGNGAGQMSRIMSCRVAIWLATENAHLGGSGVSPVAASDAFFPFRDGPDILIDAGVTAIIQPGGSKRDAETITACNERGVAMVFTQTRHLRH